MANFLKKALGVFVEFENDNNNIPTPITHIHNSPISNISKVNSSLNSEDIEKFGKHFSNLFEQANSPGPDYYEFCKMMETLEAHIQDEKTRMQAVFAALSIQGITKLKLIESAAQYKHIIDKDQKEFDLAVNEKSKIEIESRKKVVQDLDKKIISNSELIKNLTKEITESQSKIEKLKEEISGEENKLSGRTGGYKIACEAMLSKIFSDIQKLQTNL